ncbi:MAG TPA: hypothetical protein VN086_02680 [Candidatus Paceibacterota bacterium]|nr:hypothetical protein [Candidatus Paceibacterota bacterium]
MSDVEFNEPEYAATARSSRTAKQSRFERLVLSTGLAKDSKGAQRVLLIISILMLVIAAFLMWPKHQPAPVPVPPITTP